MSLLEQAKQYPLKRKKSTLEEKELALSWLRGEITNAQALVALTGKSRQTGNLYRLAFLLRDLYEEGSLTLTKKK